MKRASMLKRHFTRVLMSAFAVFFLVLGLSSCAETSSSIDEIVSEDFSLEDILPDETEEEAVEEDISEADTNDDAADAPVEADPDVPTEYISALAQAETYANMMNMSKQGVYDQLTSEYGGQFTNEAAQYAIDNVSTDWNANALAKAESYQETMHMSPDAIYDQLVSEYGEQFTPEQAQYAVDNLS